MKVKDFITWLEQQDKELEICVIGREVNWSCTGELYESFTSACFDDPQLQSTKTKSTLLLGVE